MNLSNRINLRMVALLGVMTVMLVVGAVVSVRSRASVAATAVNAPSFANVAAEHDYAARLATARLVGFGAREAASMESNNVVLEHDYVARRSPAHRAAVAASLERNYAATRGATSLERSNAASAARWQAMGQYHADREAAAIERSNAASTARWQAMAEYYAGGK